MSMTDAADAPVNIGVMIALLPMTTDWCKVDCPHMTLVYAGTTDELKPTDFNELAKDASMLAAISSPLQLKVTGVQVAGDTEKVDVLAIQPSMELWAMRRAVEDWNASDFPFQPHATIGPVGTSVQLEVIPRYLAFDRLCVGWGNEYLTFRLKSGGGVY